MSGSRGRREYGPRHRTSSPRGRDHRRSDNVLTARAFAARNRYAVDSNQELLALGASNVASGVMQGFPVSSSGSRTVIGDALGSRSRLYSLVTLALVLATLLWRGSRWH